MKWYSAQQWRRIHAIQKKIVRNATDLANVIIALVEERMIAMLVMVAVIVKSVMVAVLSSVTTVMVMDNVPHVMAAEVKHVEIAQEVASVRNVKEKDKLFVPVVVAEAYLQTAMVVRLAMRLVTLSVGPVSGNLVGAQSARAQEILSALSVMGQEIVRSVMVEEILPATLVQVRESVEHVQDLEPCDVRNVVALVIAEIVEPQARLCVLDAMELGGIRHIAP